MSKHDLKARQLQVEEIINPSEELIRVRDLLRYEQAQEYSSSRDIPDIEKVQALIGENAQGAVTVWSEESTYSLDDYVTYMIAGKEYLFRSNFDANTEVPTLLDNIDWQLIGAKDGAAINDDVIANDTTWSSRKVVAKPLVNISSVSYLGGYLSEDGARILNNYDRFTGEYFNATKITVWADGSPMTDTKVDNALYFRVKPADGGGYALRDHDGYINVKWFGVKGDGVTEDQSAFQKATEVIKAIGGGSLKVPAGTYIFNPVNKPVSNSFACVEVYSNTMVQLSRGANIKTKPNGLIQYVLFSFKNAQNSLLVGGKLIGDRYEHDYTATGTHEFGNAIEFEGETVNCAVTDSDMFGFTGDGLANRPVFNYISSITEASLESGNLDASGSAIADAARLRTTVFVTLNNPLITARGYFGLYGTGFGGYGGLDNKYYDAYFYNASGTFLKVLKQFKLYERVYVPTGATQVKFVFYKPATNTVFNINFRAEDYSQNLTVERNKIHDNRRQGISVTGCQGYLISNNDIYDIGGPAGPGQVAKAAGTDPQGGIDIEDGYQLNQNIDILNNRFKNNTGYNLVMITSVNVTVDGNFFSSDVNNMKYASFQCGPGVENLIASNNNFERGAIILGGDLNFIGNKTNDLIISTASESIANNLYLGDNSFKNTRLRIQNSSIRQNGNQFSSNPNNVKADYLLTFESSTEMVNCSFIGDGTLANINYNNGSVELKPSIIDNCDFLSAKTANVFPLPFGKISNSKFRGGLGVLIFRGTTTDVCKIYNCDLEGYLQVAKDLKTLIIRGCTFTPITALSFAYSSLIKILAGFTGTIIIDHCDFIFTSAATNYNILDFNIGGAGVLMFTNNKFIGNSKPVGLKTTDSTSTSPFIVKNNSFGGTTKLLRAMDVNEGNGDGTGVFTVSGTGQTVINIPHGLGAVPSFTNVNPKSIAARNAGILSWTEDATNIILTLAVPADTGTNNLSFVWEAKL